MQTRTKYTLIGLLPGAAIGVFVYLLFSGFFMEDTSTSFITENFLLQIFHPFAFIVALGTAAIPLLIGASLGRYFGKKSESLAITEPQKLEKSHIIFYVTMGVFILGCFLLFWYGFDWLL